MKREDLEAREFGLIIASSNFPFYAAPEADAVMDAMEARINELEKALSNAVAGGNIALEQAKKLESQLPKWISVKDRLPTSDTTQYLVYDEMTKEYGKSFFSLILKRFQFHVTHWMQLPPPPTTKVM